MSNSGIFTMLPLPVLVALGLVSQHVAAAWTPQSFPFYVDVACGTSLCALFVPRISSLSLCHLVSVADSITGHFSNSEQ